MTAISPTNTVTLPHVIAAPMPPAPARMPKQSILADPERVRMNLKLADYAAQSDLVPVHYRGKPANIFIAICRAQNLGVDEWYFLEKTFVIGGRLGIAAELVIELANNSGRFKGVITFEHSGEGKTRACTASATIASTGERVSSTVTMGMAEADGWTKNSKWRSLPDQMLAYRSAVFLIRLYAGGVTGGMYSAEELQDVQAMGSRPGPALPKPPAPTAEDRAATLDKRVTPLIELKTPGAGSISFPRTKHGVDSALKQMTLQPELVLNNLDFLDMVAEKMPHLADQVSDVRAAAAAALTAADVADINAPWPGQDAGAEEPQEEDDGATNADADAAI